MGCGNSSPESLQKKADRLAEGEAPLRYTLPQFTEGEERQERDQGLNKRQEEYQWAKNDFLTPFLKELPSDEKTLAVAGQFVDMFGPDGSTPKMKINEFLDTMQEKFGKGDNDPFEDYTKVYPGKLEGLRWVVDVPEVHKNWKEDKEFGRQRLGGCNPCSARKLASLSKLQEKMPVTDEMVEGLTEGKSLADLEAAGKLYVMDYVLADGIQDMKGIHGTFYVPVCLFFLNSSDDMMPLGIQLYQDPSKSPIFTPKHDHDGLWLLVKLAVQQTEASYQINVEHIAGMHFFSETFYVAARRRLSDHHPICQMLIDSFWCTLPVNMSARALLMAEDGMLCTEFTNGYEGMQELMKRTIVKDADFNKWVFEKDIEERGMGDCPKYYWRDDAGRGYKLWEEFIDQFIDLMYLTDKDVLEDYEVQNWATEFCAQVDYKNLPLDNGKFSNKAQLKKFLTVLLWNVTFRHMSIHMTQFEMMAFIPNCPTLLRAPLPMDNTATFTEQEIRDKYMPEWDKMIQQISFFAGVVYPPTEGKALGEFTDRLCPKDRPGHNACWALVNQFKANLKIMSSEVKERNKKVEASGDVSYKYLDPEHMWRSICF